MSVRFSRFWHGTHMLTIPIAEQANDDASSLKRDGNIILQPQPSDSPNDPLNWYYLRAKSRIGDLRF